ncbi:hypothetical protein [Micromonospora sp. NBC_00858]|nr:hypothetical protein OG990_05345 [Micromonospora sp. NBC_00858]
MRIAVSLGAGEARGYAQIGAIQVLEERGFGIVAIADRDQPPPGERRG